jgi:diguanylate cyclase (GGDEF)-like protein
MSEHDGIRSDLRQHVGEIILARTDGIADASAAAVPAPFSGDRGRSRLALQLATLLGHTAGDGGIEGRGGLVAQLSATAAEYPLTPPQLFALAAAVERAALEELALDETIGAVTEHWGTAAQIVRQASFDLLAGVVARTCRGINGVTDPLTGTRTRLYFDAALATECDRAGRFGDRLALIVFRLDDRAGIEARLGPGISEKVLERLGILVRTYFRRLDLVARYTDDAVAVLLVRSDAEHAEGLADGVRRAIEQRLESADHRSGESIAITASAAVIHAGGTVGAVVEPERLTVDAERALGRAAAHGGNRLEVIQSAAAIRIPPRSSPSA